MKKQNEYGGGVIVVRRAKLVDLSNICKLHKECFCDSFLVLLGDSLIQEFYKSFLQEKKSPFVIAENGRGDTIGFCMGYYNNSKARKQFIKNNRLKLFIKLIVLCASFNVKAIQRCKSYLWSKFKLSKEDLSNVLPESLDNGADLLSICVSPNYRGKGVSVELLNCFESELASMGIDFYTLTVLKSNLRAVTFYNKMDLVVVFERKKSYVMMKSFLK